MCLNLSFGTFEKKNYKQFNNIYIDKSKLASRTLKYLESHINKTMFGNFTLYLSSDKTSFILKPKPLIRNKDIFYGYKVYEKIENKLYYCCGPYIQKNTWYKANNVYIQNVNFGYTTGFHILHTKKDAIKFARGSDDSIYKVEYKNPIHLGLDGNNCQVVIANNMKVLYKC